MYKWLVWLLLPSFVFCSVDGKAGEKWSSKCDSLERAFRETPGDEKFPAAVELVTLLEDIDLNTARSYASLALKEAERIGSKYYVGRFILFKGEIERLNANYSIAFRTLEQSIAYAKKYGYEDLYAQSLLVKAKAHLDLSMMDASYRDLVEAMPIYEKIKDDKGLRGVLTVLGCIYLNEKNPEAAIPYFIKAQEIDLKYRYVDLLMSDAVNIALAYTTMSKPDSALIFYEQALTLIDLEKYSSASITVYMNLAWYYIERKEKEKAMDLMKKVLAESQLSLSHKLYSQVLFTAGWMYEENGEEEEGLKYLKKAFDMSQRFSFVDVAFRASERISRFYMRKKQYEPAAYWLNLKSIYADSSAQRQNINNLTHLRYKYEYEQQLQDIAYQQRIHLFAWIFIIFVLSLIIVLLLITFSRYRLKLKNSELTSLNMANELEHKKKEVFTKVLYLRKKNEAIQEIAERLIEKKPLFKQENQVIISGIVKDLLDYCKDDSWKEFELRFEEIYVDFFKKLSEQFPDLTANEKRLCAYLKLNMTTKNIATLLHMSVAGVESARYRLRKKLKINNTEVELNAFFETL